MARTGPSFVRFIESITVDNAGSGYSSSNPPTLYIGAPNLTSTAGDKVQATASVTIFSGSVDTLTITNAGDGYVTAPVVKLIGTLGAVTFTAQTDVNRGAGTFSSVSQSATSGIGTGAKFTIVVNSGGSVSSVIITTIGTGYAEGDTITIPDTNIGGDGSAADITVTVSKIAGNGSGAVFTAAINYINRPQEYFHQNSSYIVPYQIAEWIRNEYPTYTRFIEAYFNYLDADDELMESLGASTPSPNYILQELIDRFSISHYHTDFLQTLLEQYAVDFPDEKQLDTKFLIKQIRSFYTSKGSREAIKTLFRIIYNEEIEIFKPSEYILRASDGIWTNELSIKVYANDEYSPIYNPLDLRAREVDIYYYESTASLTARKKINTSVTRARKIAYTNPSVYELTVNLPANTTIPGTGVECELDAVIGGVISTVTNIGAADVLRDNSGSPYTITTGFTSDGNGSGAEFTVTVDGSGAASITVDDGGDDYAPGETITIPDSLLGSGGAADLTFDVDEITNGKIFSVTITDPGLGYSANPLITIIPDPSDTITTEAVLYTRITNGTISSVIVNTEGLGYNKTPILTLNTDPFRTYIAFPDTSDAIENKKGFLTRVLNEVTIKSDTGAADGGFEVGQTFQVSETGDILGVYAIGYFLEDYTITGIANNAYIRISAVDADNYPTGIDIITTGVGFFRAEFDFTINSGNGESAVVTCTTGFAHTYPGQFKNSRGFLSDANKLQNNALYQPYAYQIQSSLPKSRWGEILKRTAHPAGMEVFSDLQIVQAVNFSTGIDVVPDVFFFYKIFLEQFIVNDAPALFFSRPVADSVVLTSGETVTLLTTLFKFETPSAIDAIDKFDVTVAKSENLDMSELVQKDVTKPTIADSVDMSETVVLLLQILRNPDDSIDMSETVTLLIALNKAENPTVDDAYSLQPNLIKTESPSVDDAKSLEPNLIKPEDPTADDNLVYLFDSDKSEDYTVSEAGQLIMQNYAGDYFAEDYVGEVRNF